METTKNQYIPQVVFHPGETLAENLRKWVWDQKNLPYVQENPKNHFGNIKQQKFHHSRNGSSI